MDLAPVARGAADLLSGNWSLEGLWLFVTSYPGLFSILAIAAVLYFSGLGRRIWRVTEELFFTNWQLALLASTGVALSLASGYTTFDGLRNFTSAPLLSVAISFGIQGVMLIVAWLIGESFASGMSTVKRRSYARAGAPLIVVTVALAVFCLLAAFVLYVAKNGFQADTWMNGFGLAALALGGIVLLMLFSKSDVLAPYTQAGRLIMQNGVLWVMFLSSMAASVFFSFDSHFNAIFPADARARAAEIRTTGQIGGVIADVGALAQARQIEEADKLFSAKGWRDYDAQLTKLAQVSQGAQREIEAYYEQQLEARNAAVKQQQERIETAHSGQAGLASKKISLTDELSRLKGERPGLAAQFAQTRADVEAKLKEIDVKRVEALAEDRGVEGTLKQGKGPAYRQLMGELQVLRDQHEILEERSNNAKKRLAAAETRITNIERELASVDGDLAKLKGDAETAEQRIKMVQSAGGEAAGTKLDPARVLLAFERARASFRQHPDTERLGALQQQCTNLVNAMSSTGATKERVRDIDCDPKQAAEAASRVFALNAGLVAFQANCAGGDKLAQYTTTDALLAFGRKCLQDSGLVSQDSADIGARLSAIDMNRDDKAHRFVVTWNAFLDGNRLAYLALILAIGVDALVFMSGLFGANAIRSPLSDVPSAKARTAEQLEAVIETALLPDKFENASAVLDAMDPITLEDGFSAEVVLPYEDTAGKRRIMKVLNAAATIGAVSRDQRRPDRYLVRGELFEFLSTVAKKEFEADKRHVNLAELERVVSVALLPRVGENAETVLSYLHPIREKQGLTAEIKLEEVEKEHLRMVRSALNAGATLDRVQRAGDDAKHYYIHSDFYRTLARIRARLLVSAASYPRRGGAIEEYREAIEAGPGSQQAIAHDQIAAPRGIDRATEVDAEPIDLARLVTERLLSSIGIKLEHYELINEPAIHDHAVNAGKALDQLRTTQLGDKVRQRERKLQAILEATQKSIEASLQDDVQLRVLMEASQRVYMLLPALMLTPRGPFERLLREMIGELEEAAAADNGHRTQDHELVKSLQALWDKLHELGRDTPASWFEVGNVLLGYEEASIELPRVATGHYTKQ
jgi:hypothetical protein